MTANPIAQYPQGGSGSLVPISEQVLGSTASSVTFILPAGYQYFKLFINAGNTSNAATFYYINFNGDVTSTHYFGSYINQAYATGAPSSGGGFVNTGAIIPTSVSETTIYPSSSGANCASIGNNGQGGTAINLTGSQWVGSAVPTSMVITPNAGTFNSGGVFSLFGIK